MLGRSRSGWRFKERTPLWVKLIVGLLFADSMLRIVLQLTVSSWARASLDALHPYRLPFRDGRIYFAPLWLGKYADAWWISVALFAVMVVLLVLKRDQLERSDSL